MRKFILSVLLVVGIAGLSFAAVVVESNGTRVKKTETLNVIGASVTNTANEIIINTRLSSMSVDTALYTTSRGTGGQKVLCVAIDGTIYASATNCF